MYYVKKSRFKLFLHQNKLYLLFQFFCKLPEVSLYSYSKLSQKLFRLKIVIIFIVQSIKVD